MENITTEEVLDYFSQPDFEMFGSNKVGFQLHYPPTKGGTVNLKYEIFYIKRSNKGLKKCFYENGTLKSTTIWAKGVQVGGVKKFKKDGVEKLFDENGTLKSKTTWVNGVQVGDVKKFNKDGTPKE